MCCQVLLQHVSAHLPGSVIRLTWYRQKYYINHLISFREIDIGGTQEKISVGIFIYVDECGLTGRKYF
jgi:hypothetical protein